MNFSGGLNNCRKDFPFFNTPGVSNPVYLDTAATSQKPQVVIDRLIDYYSRENANIHRGLYDLSARATDAYEAVRAKVVDLVNAPGTDSVVFTRGATESINLIAYAWARNHLKPGDEILATEMEHHSNLVPWQEAARKTGAVLKLIPITETGELDLDQVKSLISTKTKIMAFVHQSNVLGTINPVKELAALAKKVGAISVMDAAQSAPHGPVDFQDIGCDFMAFSGHKMCAPTGVGVLIGKPELLNAMDPFLTGGEMIDEVFDDHSTWNELPHKFEAGTPNIAQVIGLGAAIDYLKSLGLAAIHQYGQEFGKLAQAKLSAIPGLKLYGTAKDRGPVFSFGLEGLHPQDIEFVLNKEGVAVRTGHHCTQPLLRRLQVSSLIRASFYIYSTEDDVDRLCAALKKAQQFFS